MPEPAMTSASPDAELSLLPAFLERVRHANPMHRSFLDRALPGITPRESVELDDYLVYCNSRNLGIDYLAKCYLTIVEDTLREQLYFQRHRKYRHSTFADVAGHVYSNREYMAYYMHGLALTSYLWPNHLALLRFFKETLPRNQPGRYLEVGPGHGFFFTTAMRESRYDDFFGVDVSETSIRLTRELVDRRGGGRTANVRLECADFLDAELPAASFEAIVMGEVLEHVEHPERFLRRMASLAAEDAYLFVTTCINAPAIDHIHLFESPAELRALFESCGLAIRRERIVPCAGKTLDECLDGRYTVNVGYVLEPTRASS